MACTVHITCHPDHPDLVNDPTCTAEPPEPPKPWALGTRRPVPQGAHVPTQLGCRSATTTGAEEKKRTPHTSMGTTMVPNVKGVKPKHRMVVAILQRMR